MKIEKILFDCRGIGPNDVALFMKNGKRVLLDKKQYFKVSDRELKIKAEDINVREFDRVRKPCNFRSGLTAKIERSKACSRSNASRKRISLRQANYQRQSLFD
jgi:hypothetical protein